MAGGCRRRTRSCRSIRTRRCRWRRWCGNRARRRGCAGRRGSRTASCGASTDAGLWSAAREHGEVEGCACGCSYVHCRETHVRLTSDGGAANEMLLFHGTGATKPKARAELGGATAVGCSENVYCSSARREGLMWEVQARVSLAHRLGLGCPCARDCKCDAACGAAALKRRGDEGGRGLAVGRAICEVESLQPMRSSCWSRCCSTAMPEARGSPDWR